VRPVHQRDALRLERAHLKEVYENTRALSEGFTVFEFNLNALFAFVKWYSSTLNSSSPDTALQQGREAFVLALTSRNTTLRPWRVKPAQQ